MQIQVNVKQSLYRIFLIASIGLTLVSCIGSGDAYKSMLCSQNCSSNDYKYWAEVSQDRRKVRYIDDNYGTYPSTNWVDLKQGGVGVLYGYPYFEIQNGKFRVYANGVAGNWANICGKDRSVAKYSSSNDYPYEYIAEVDNGKFRICYSGYWSDYQTVCGNWVEFDYSYVCVSCPQGYTYNPNRNICEAEPIYNYTCPYAGGTCVENTKSVAYCSPYNCNSTSAGVWCASGNINTSNMTANSIGMWQCSYDSSWFVDEASCKTGCNYFKCSYNNNWYQGDKSICELNCREKGQCVEVNQ